MSSTAEWINVGTMIVVLLLQLYVFYQAIQMRRRSRSRSRYTTAEPPDDVSIDDEWSDIPEPGTDEYAVEMHGLQTIVVDMPINEKIDLSIGGYFRVHGSREEFAVVRGDLDIEEIHEHLDLPEHALVTHFHDTDAWLRREEKREYHSTTERIAMFPKRVKHGIQQRFERTRDPMKMWDYDDE